MRQPQLAFDAGNKLVLALEQGSGRVARYYRGAHGVLQPYGVVDRLEELAQRPQIAPRRNAFVLVPRAEAYVLFAAALRVASDDRDVVAERMQIAIGSARRWCGDLSPRGIYEPGDVVQAGGALLILLPLEDGRSPEWAQVYDGHHTPPAGSGQTPA